MWAVRNAIIFSQGILQQDNHIFIFSPADVLLESAIRMEVRAILGGWRFVGPISAVFGIFETKGPR